MQAWAVSLRIVHRAIVRTAIVLIAAAGVVVPAEAAEGAVAVVPDAAVLAGAAGAAAVAALGVRLAFEQRPGY
jgi:hypothetical protein